MIGRPLVRRSTKSTAIRRPTKITVVRRSSNTTFGTSQSSASTSSAKGKGGKGKKRKEPTVTQRQTRSQVSRGSKEASIQAKTKARMAKKVEKIRAKAVAAQG
ncbi:hypothetical protein NE237_001089 [Protea cynaroides]|uniref:Uncharacterized protein n=1 Tax=Protea cynaroides TaxID=273540 RepID=A0A9Q0KSH8_9MAGN|nr:hypothetical protein NE237_001089 [Protea cynaroides]